MDGERIGLDPLRPGERVGEVERRRADALREIRRVGDNDAFRCKTPAWSAGRSSRTGDDERRWTLADCVWIGAGLQERAGEACVWRERATVRHREGGHA